MRLSIKQFIVLVALAIVNLNPVYSLEPEGKISASTQSTDHQFFISIYDLLHDAIKVDNPLEVEMFIEFGADINHRYIDGKTPLMIASSLGSTNTVKILLELGADTELKSNDGMTAIDYANKNIEKLILYTLKNNINPKLIDSSTNTLHANDIIIAEDIPDQY